MALAIIKSLVNETEIVGCIENHTLHQLSEKSIEQKDLVNIIINNGKLLFALLVVANLEHLTPSLFSRGLSDDSLFDFDRISWDLPSEEEHKLVEKSNLIAPLFKKAQHYLIHDKITLPFITRAQINHGAFGVVYRVEIAKGHLEGYEEVSQYTSVWYACNLFPRSPLSPKNVYIQTIPPGLRVGPL